MGHLPFTPKSAQAVVSIVIEQVVHADGEAKPLAKPLLLRRIHYRILRRIL